MAYPYVMSTEKLKEFLVKISGIGIPTQVDGKFLRSLGYTSSNDERFLGAIKFIGLVENKRGGAPTELWRKLRTDFGGAIAEGTFAGYAELFSMYPNAHKQDNEALNSFFAAKTTLGNDTIAKVISTFKVFAELGKFDDMAAPETSVNEASDPDLVNSRVVERKIKASSGVVINVNIQLQVPPDSTGEIYDQFFASMKKHLLDQ